MRARVTDNSVYSAYTQRDRRPSRSWQSIIAATVAVLVLPSVARSQAASSCPSGPQYSDTRYDDDFSYLRDPVCRNDFWDSLKYISLNARGDWYLSLGGEIRERYERFTILFGDSNPKVRADICCNAISCLAISTWEKTYGFSLN